MLHKDRRSLVAKDKIVRFGVPPPPQGYFGSKSFYLKGLQVGSGCKGNYPLTVGKVSSTITSVDEVTDETLYFQGLPEEIP
jgi:hypothetical protein